MSPITVTDVTFDEQVLASPVPVLLDVWAPWCVPCRGMTPALDEIAVALAGRVRVAKLNADQNPAVTGRLCVVGIPTLVLFRQGREVDRMIGTRSKEEVLRRLAALHAPAP
jgi:thioredoxin